MTSFAYEAARTDGGVVRGSVDAESQPDAAALLSARGLFPIVVEVRPERSNIFVQRPSARALATVFQSLAALVEAGIPMHKALHATQALARGTLAEALQRVEACVRDGSSLGAALAIEGTFSGVAVGLVRAGERGVGLAAGLAQAARQLDRDAQAAARIKSALAYPLLLTVVGTASVALIMFFVVPRFAALLADMGQTLPTATRILLAISQLVRSYGVAVGVVGAVFVVAAARLAVARRAAWHAWLLESPVIGPLRHTLATARVARALGALLSTGTPALAALETAQEAAGDAAVAARLGAARLRVAQGAGLTAALENARALTPRALQLAAIGEGSGKLPDLLGRAADIEEQRAEQQLKMLVACIEPALIFLFATVVAFVAAALLQAVYSLRPGL